MESKKCKDCQKNLSIDCFSKSSIYLDGMSFYCKACTSIRSKKYRDANPKIINEIPSVPENAKLLTDIKGMEFAKGYCIDKCGTVYTCNYKGSGTGLNYHNEWKLLNKRIDTKGYDRITLFDGQKKTDYRTHRIVASAFIPNPDNKSDINHINGVRADNRVENLEWCTRSENIKHSYEFLNHKRMQGTLSPKSKLTEEQVREILFHLRDGLSIREIAAKYSIHHSIVQGIKQGKRWKHVNAS